MSDSLQPSELQPARLLCPWDLPGKNTGRGCHFLLQCMKMKSESEVAQACPTPSKPMDCSLPGSSVHGICQARVLEGVAISFSGKRSLVFPEISSLSHSIVFLYFFALIAEKGFLIATCYSLDLHSDAYVFPFLLCFSLLFFSQLFVRPPQTAILLFCISFPWGLYGMSSVQFSRSVVSNSLRLHESQHTRPPCPSPAP